jgi:hypothetical protein
VKDIDASTTVDALAGIVAGHLRTHGIEIVLSGGALAGIYSDGAYRSEDLDMVTYATTKALEPALAELGFRKGAGRHFLHPATPLMLEFPRAPVAVGREIVGEIAHLDTLNGRVAVLTPTDAVKDRLAGYIHWKQASNFEQARLIAECRDIDRDAVIVWAEKEGASPEMLSRIRQMLRNSAEARPPTPRS